VDHPIDYHILNRDYDMLMREIITCPTERLLHVQYKEYRITCPPIIGNERNRTKINTTFVNIEINFVL